MKDHGFSNVPGAEDLFDGHTTTPWGDFKWRAEEVSCKVKYIASPADCIALEAKLIRRLKYLHNVRGVCRGR